jgi:CheY-like chemotaxis protein
MTALDRHARILVIDDDDIVRTLLIETLEAKGHTVFELPSAIGATRLIAQNAIDTVILDVMLPDIDGDKLAKLLRTTPRGSEIVIVLVSSRSIEELEAMAAKVGADAVVSKSDIRWRLAPTVDAARHKRAAAANRPRSQT